jgi:malonate transporter
MPHVIFTVLAPIFFVIALGYVAGRMRSMVIRKHPVQHLNAGDNHRHTLSLMRCCR